MVRLSKIKCKVCDTVLESKYINDMIFCGCRNQTFITGGDTDFRYGGVNRGKIEVIDDPRLKDLTKPYKKIKHG